MTRVRVWHLAVDHKNGTESMAFANERDAEDTLLSLYGESRESFESWCTDNARDASDFWDFVEGVKDDLDTFGLEYSDLDLDKLERLG